MIPQRGRSADGSYKGADALVIDSGANNEDELYCKSKALQTWLLGYEFTETVILVCSRSIYVLTSKKKVSHLEPMKTAENATLPLELLARDKTDGYEANYGTLIKALQASHAGKVVATLGKGPLRHPTQPLTPLLCHVGIVRRFDSPSFALQSGLSVTLSSAGAALWQPPASAKSSSRRHSPNFCLSRTRVRFRSPSALQYFRPP